MDEVTERIKALYVEEGQTLRQIAAKMGVSHQAVHYRLKKAGIQLRDRKVNSRSLVIDRTLLTHLYVNKKLSMAETAKRLNCSASAVLTNLRQLGIEQRNSGPRPTVYAAIYTMKIGQEVLVRKPNQPYPAHAVLEAGERIGFELEAEVISDDLLLVTRLS